MALKGSLEDFSIVNILQMIKLEGKTGKLHLQDKDDEVKITFDKGSIIYAEGGTAVDDFRIENTLVNNSLIKSADWTEVKKEHEDKLKPYWDLLPKKVDPKVLVELINRQTIDSVYFGLRWTKGTYEFTPVKNLRYNNKVMRPMDVDALLMDGCYIADEWARVKASIPEEEVFIVKNILGESDEPEQPAAKKEEQAADFRNSLEYDVLSARGIELSNSQVAVLAVIGKGKTIKEIINSARQGGFDTIQAISKLLTMGIIKVGRRTGGAMMQVDNSSNLIPMAVSAALAAVLVMGGMNQVNAFQSSDSRKQGLNAVKVEMAKAGLLKIQRAVKIYMILKKEAPQTVDDLIIEGALDPMDSLDPWENKYKLEAGEKSIAIFSLGPDIGLQSDNIHIQEKG